MSEWGGFRSIRSAFAGASGGYLAPSTATTKPTAARDPHRDSRRKPAVSPVASARAGARLVIAYE